MCWSESASLAMVGLGGAATAITVKRDEPAAIPVTLAYFTFMEALQVGSYWIVDDCGLAANRAVTVVAYLHIALQPIVINAFAMATAPDEVRPGTKRIVYALATLAAVALLLRLVPFGWAGPCAPGDPLCGQAFCTVSGNWHIAWEMPLNDMWRALGVPFADLFPFPFYMAAAFVLPLFYGAWRFAIFHAFVGPLLASALTDDPNEMPAVWCLLSVGIVILSLSPLIRRKLLGTPRRSIA